MNTRFFRPLAALGLAAAIMVTGIGAALDPDLQFNGAPTTPDLQFADFLDHAPATPDLQVALQFNAAPTNPDLQFC
jgi:hypothetical protein